MRRTPSQRCQGEPSARSAAVWGSTQVEVRDVDVRLVSSIIAIRLAVMRMFPGLAISLHSSSSYDSELPTPSNRPHRSWFVQLCACSWKEATKTLRDALCSRVRISH